MIGFPLQLPIEASVDREIVLAHTNVTVSQPGLPTLLHDHLIQLRIEVTAEEATALRAWMAMHAKGVPPMVAS